LSSHLKLPRNFHLKKIYSKEPRISAANAAAADAAIVINSGTKEETATKKIPSNVGLYGGGDKYNLSFNFLFKA